MEKILTYMNNDRKQNLSVVSSFSHFVELFLIWCSKTIREKATASLQSRCLKVIWSRERLGPMTETCKGRESPLFPHVSVYTMKYLTVILTGIVCLLCCAIIQTAYLY